MRVTASFQACVTPERRHRGALIGLALCPVAWPLTSLTIFSSEPQGVLGLSWMSLILTCINIAATTDVRRQHGT